MGIKKRVINFLVILSFTLTSFFLNHYQYGVEDQAITIPIIRKYLNPYLYSNDYLLSQPRQSTLFTPIMALLTELFGSLETTTVIVYLISLFFLFFGMFMLTNGLFKNKLANFFVLSFMLFPKWIGGTGVQTYENYLAPRTLGLPLMLFSLYFMINDRFYWGALLGGITFLVHPVSGLPLFVVLLLFLSTSFRSAKSFLPVLLFAITSLLLIIIAQKEVAGSFQMWLMPNDWLSIVKMRDPFIFPHLWKLRSYGSLVLYVIFILIYFSLPIFFKKQKIKIDARKKVILITTAALTPFLLSTIIPLTLPLTIFIQLEPARSVVLFAYLALSCLAFTVSHLIIKPRLSLKIYAVVLFFMAFLWNNNIVKNVDKDFIDTQKWAKKNTSIHSLFLTPPLEKGFRIFSERNIVGEYKDGGPVLFSYQFAKEWKERMNRLKTFNQLSEENLKLLANHYQFDYLVTKKSKKFSFSLVYQNPSYRIYKMQLTSSFVH